ncbi:di-heme oxidoredictase family protein [Halioxenophilus aromaticivorans]|uniref:di-heme oxidoreductase family protein n=1 Tax=Halioxenophilus aromaticivorans TaxID=1306992 RepID=UPI0031EFB6F6
MTTAKTHSPNRYLAKSLLHGTTVIGFTLLSAMIAGCGGKPNTAAKAAPLAIEIPAQLGGDNSVNVQSSNAFSLPSAAMPLTQKINFSVGNSFFRNAWVIAPASTAARDGLGPLFNTNGCQNCHIKDGRGHLPQNDDDNAVSMLVRLSVAGEPESASDGAIGHPVYGGQLQDFAIPGHQPEAKIGFDYEFQTVTLTGGEQVELRKPILRLSDFSDEPITDATLTSVRIAPPVIGLGYLEALSDSQILAQADPSDENKDGISGKAAQVWDVAQATLTLGRFGWKAEQPSLKQQNAAAFAGDMGLTSPLSEIDDCTAAQAKCLEAANGGSPEVSDKILNLVTFYTSNLAVPARRSIDDPAVQTGEVLFQTIGCASCHTPKWQVGEVADMPWLGNQTIYPFTDMLLHDMGEGLSDGRKVFNAEGQEWRTQPLWGIGLTATINNEFGYLHDGRARTLQEAIIWHGGEAKASRDEFKALSAAERAQLMAFLNSL